MSARDALPPPPRNPGLQSSWNWAGAAAIWAVILLLPALQRDWLGVAALVMVGVMYGLGLHIITGLTGMLNLGFVGCAAFGAYLGCYLLKILAPQLEGAWASGAWQAHAGLSHQTAVLAAFLLAMLAVIAGSSLLGLVLGYPTLKLSGDYYAIVTLAFSEIILLAIKNLAPITGGTASMRDIPEVHFWPDLDYRLVDIHNHYVIAAALLFTMLAVLGLQFSRFGRALGALRDNRTAAEAAGINPVYYFTLASVISSVAGGIAGFVLAEFYFTSSLNYTSFLFMGSAMVVCYVVMGGLGSYRGAVVGSIALASATEIMRLLVGWWNSTYDQTYFHINEGLRYLFFGLVLILAMRFMPEGVFGRLRSRSRGGGASSPEPGSPRGPQPTPADSEDAASGLWPSAPAPARRDAP